MMSQIFEQLFIGMGKAVDFLKAIEVVSGVSVWTVICCCIIMSVVISGLINVVRIGDVTSRAISTARSRRSKGDDD